MNIQLERPNQDERAKIYTHFLKTIEDTFEMEKIQGSREMILYEVDQQMQQLDRDFESDGKREYFLIAKQDDRIIGTIAYGEVNALIREHLGKIEEEMVEIKSVYISPDVQNKGVGSFLFEQIQILLSEKHLQPFCLDCGYRLSQVFWRKKLGNPRIVLSNYWSEGCDHMIWVI